MRSAPEIVVVEAIKLVEGGLAELCDDVWLVTCAPTTQRDRLMGRGAPADDADRRIAAQAGLAARVADAATRTIDTTADVGRDPRARRDGARRGAGGARRLEMTKTRRGRVAAAGSIDRTMSGGRSAED